MKSAKPIASVSTSPAQITVQQSFHATIVANGALTLALQTAMRSAVINSVFEEDHLQSLVSQISSIIADAPASGFAAEDVKVGKGQALKFVEVISDAIRRETSTKVT